jgi:di/tricarboxylate transporter
MRSAAGRMPAWFLGALLRQGRMSSFVALMAESPLPAAVQPWFVLGLVVVAVVLFAREKFGVEIVTLSMLFLLVASGILTPAQAFAGFASDVIIVLGSIFVVTGALQDTGVLDVVGRKLLRLESAGESRVLLVLMGMVAGFSSFLNNTTVTGMLLGPTISFARRRKFAVSRLLMPLAFASILGGTCTVIGTSTNVAVSGQLAAHGFAPIGFFEIMPLGLLLVGAGIVFMIVIGRHLLPGGEGEGDGEQMLAPAFLSEIVVLPDSKWIGKRLGELALSRHGVEVVRVHRGEDEMRAARHRKLREGDVLLVLGRSESLLEIKAAEGLEIHSEVKLGSLRKPSDEFRIAEGVLLPDSRLVGHTVKELGFYETSGVTILGISRRGKPRTGTLADLRFAPGDAILVQGEAEALDAMQANYSVAFTSEVNTSRLRRGRGFLVGAAMVLAVVAAALELAPLSICFLAAALLTVLAGCITSERALDHIDWRLLILIGGMSAFGEAIVATGGDVMLADAVGATLAPFGSIVVLAGFMMVTIALSQPMSNAAAALVVLPIALRTASDLAIDPRTFGIGIMMAASVSLATPFEPSCILVYGPGRYRFRDFVVVGLPLTFILAAIVLFGLPLFWTL